MQIPERLTFLWELQYEYTTILLAINSYWPPHTLIELHQLRTVPKDPTKYIPIKANPIIHAGITGLLTFHEEDDDDFGRPSSVLLDVAIARVLESSGVWRLEVWFEYQTSRKRVGLLGRVQLPGPL